MKRSASDSRHEHIALHLAHRWFAFLEAPGGDLEEHLKIFHPQVHLSGHRGTHLFARDRIALVSWFNAIPDEISSHHIVHSSFRMVDASRGELDMVVAYQAPGSSGVHGSIISYETLIEFTADGARFVALDKTPTLANTRDVYETSWSVNRVLARIHADLGGITGSDNKMRLLLGSADQRISAHTTASEGSGDYEAIVTAIGVEPRSLRILRLGVRDDVNSPLPVVETVELIQGAS